MHWDVDNVGAACHIEEKGCRGDPGARIPSPIPSLLFSVLTPSYTSALEAAGVS